MTLYQFRALDELEQWQVVWDIEPMLTRTEAGYRYDLYQVDAFYVEVKYRLPNNRISLRCFITTELLAPYLEQIDISTLKT